MLPELETAISWRNWPLAERGAKGWLVAGLVALLAAGLWLVLLLSLPPFAAFLLGAAFIGLLLPYYLPVAYSVNAQGLSIQRSVFPARLKPWSNFAEFKETERGYWLIPAHLSASNPTLEPFRALFLPHPPDPRLKVALASCLTNVLKPPPFGRKHR